MLKATAEKTTAKEFPVIVKLQPAFSYFFIPKGVALVYALVSVHDFSLWLGG